MNLATRIYVGIFLVSLTVTLASVLILEIFAHPTVALILHPCIVMATVISLMINCQYQRRRRVRDEVESGTVTSDIDVKEDPPPEYELPPTYTEAVLKPCVSAQLSAKTSVAFEHSSHL